MSQLIESLRYNLEDSDQPVEIVEGYKFQIKELIRRIELYRVSKFETGDYDSQNNRKYFFNVTNPQCGNATKNIDLDRKDIRVHALRAKDRVKAMLYNDELKYWMRKESFGQILNKTAENLPIYGSVILKKVGDMVVYRPLRYLSFDPAISNSPNNYNIQSPYLIDKHTFTAAELEKMKSKGWDSDAVDDLVSQMRTLRIREVCVYEQYVEVHNSELDLASDGYSMSVSYIGYLKEKESKVKRDGDISAAYFVLYKNKVNSIPYKKLDFLTVEGRALGLGISEMLFPLQERRNEIGNQKADSMRLASKTVFQTRDSNIGSNILTETLNGDIIKVNSELTRVDVAERNIGAYSQEEYNIRQDIRDNANSQEILTGENLPSRTPFRLAVLQQENAAKLFDFIRENEAMFFEEVIKEWIIPEFEKSVNKEHIFETYSRDTINAIMEEHSNYRINEAIKKYVITKGIFPSNDDINALKDDVMNKTPNSQFVKIIENYYKNFDKDLDIDISGEKHNPAQEIESITNFIQLLAQNPTAMEDPRLKGLIEELASRAGIQPSMLSSSKTGMQPSLTEQALRVGTPNSGVPPLAK